MPFKIAVCFREQILEEIPFNELYDYRMDLIVSDAPDDDNLS